MGARWIGQRHWPMMVLHLKMIGRKENKWRELLDTEMKLHCRKESLEAELKI